MQFEMFEIIRNYLILHTYVSNLKFLCMKRDNEGYARDDLDTDTHFHRQILLFKYHRYINALQCDAQSLNRFSIFLK
jgi:hypothetical protein